MKGHVYVPVESIYTQNCGCGDSKAKGSCQKATCCTAGTICSQPAMHQAHFAAVAAAFPITGYTGLQQYKGNYFLSMPFGLDTAWIYWRDGTQTSVSVLGVTSLRSRSQGAEQTSRERAVPGPSAAQQAEPQPSTGTEDTQLHSTAGHGHVGPGSSHIFPDPPWFVITLCGKATNEPQSPRQQITEMQPPQGLFFSGGSKWTCPVHK